MPFSRHTALALLCAACAACGAGPEIDPQTDEDTLLCPDSSSDSTRARETASEAVAACFAAWSEPASAVAAIARPDASFEAMRFTIDYAVGGDGAKLVLTDLSGESAVRPGDGPFSVGTHSGSWVELRDADDVTLYTQIAHELVPESVEVAMSDTEWANPTYCPENGFIRRWGLPNHPEAEFLVLFQEPVDGRFTGETVEFARFELP